MTNPQSAIRNPQPQDGVLLINKPADWTSHDVVAKLRKVLKTRRIGHTGTLDPFATGVLVVCVNRATRLVQFLTADEKEYVATMRLGMMTDTGDFTGTPVGEAKDASHITMDNINAVLPNFRGVIQQTPPMYSAKKIAGQKLYELARRGETVERAAITVEIKELELLSGAAGEFTFRVVCSTGTYIRTLAEDIGLQLGVGAHLLALQRTRVATHHLTATQSLSNLIEGRELPRLLPMNDALDLPTLLVNETDCTALFHGKVLRREPLNNAITQAKCVDQSGALIAIVEYDAAKNGWQPRVVFN